MKKEKILMAGDIGGTKSLLALYKLEGREMKPYAEREYASKQFDDFYTIVRHFIDENQVKPEIAVFGIPGPVSKGEVKSTNLPWLIRENDLISDTGIPEVKLINDLAAAAYAIPGLLVNEMRTLIDGVQPENPQRYVIIAPGTGLGQAFLVCSESRKIVIPSEGGHAGFAPSNLLEMELFKFLHSRFGRVSLERIISGSGLPNVFDFLVEDQKQHPKKETLEQMKTRDRAIVISEMALGNKDQVCAQ
ncbi:MAG: glucokinase, partial [Bacteroidales bacterium]